MSVYVVCPVRDKWELTRAMLASLDPGEVTDALILDNGSIDETAQRIRQWQGSARGRMASYYPLGAKLHRKLATDRSIYEMWNTGFARARKLAGHTLPSMTNPGRYEPFYVLITNNDILLPTGALRALRLALEGDPAAAVAYPDYDAPWQPDASTIRACTRATRGVLSEGGMFGACFMLAGHLITWEHLVTDTGYLWWYGDNHLAEMIEQAGWRQLRCVGVPVQHANEATASDYPHLDAFKWHDRQRWITRYNRTD